MQSFGTKWKMARTQKKQPQKRKLHSPIVSHRNYFRNRKRSTKIITIIRAIKRQQRLYPVVISTAVSAQQKNEQKKWYAHCRCWRATLSNLISIPIWSKTNINTNGNITIWMGRAVLFPHRTHLFICLVMVWRVCLFSAALSLFPLLLLLLWPVKRSKINQLSKLLFVFIMIIYATFSIYLACCCWVFFCCPFPYLPFFYTFFRCFVNITATGFYVVSYIQKYM